MERRATPWRRSISVSSMFEQLLDSFTIVPVVLAKQHGREAVLVELPARDEDVQGAVVVGRGSVIRHLGIVGVGAALYEQACQLGMMSDAGGAIEGAFELGFGLVALFKESSIRAGSSVE